MRRNPWFTVIATDPVILADYLQNQKEDLPLWLVEILEETSPAERIPT